MVDPGSATAGRLRIAIWPVSPLAPRNDRRPRFSCRPRAGAAECVPDQSTPPGDGTAGQLLIYPDKRYNETRSATKLSRLVMSGGRWSSCPQHLHELRQGSVVDAARESRRGHRIPALVAHCLCENLGSLIVLDNLNHQAQRHFPCWHKEAHRAHSQPGTDVDLQRVSLGRWSRADSSGQAAHHIVGRAQGDPGVIDPVQTAEVRHQETLLAQRGC